MTGISWSTNELRKSTLRFCFWFQRCILRIGRLLTRVQRATVGSQLVDIDFMQKLPIHTSWCKRLDIYVMCLIYCVYQHYVLPRRTVISIYCKRRKSSGQISQKLYRDFHVLWWVKRRRFFSLLRFLMPRISKTRTMLPQHASRLNEQVEITVHICFCGLTTKS